MNTPLWQALQAAVGRRAASFHTPGHKNGRIVPQALAAGAERRTGKQGLNEGAFFFERKAF